VRAILREVIWNGHGTVTHESPEPFFEMEFGVLDNVQTTRQKSWKNLFECEDNVMCLMRTIVDHD
jgi:hypothetical protein